MNHIESIFGTVKSRHKIYCLEASAATHAILPHFKKHIMDVLKSQSHHGDSRKFNIVCFNSDVAKWCVTIVPCTLEHVLAAEDWLRHIQPEGTCNFLGAIVSALRESTLNSLCFIVTQKPNQDIDDILDLFAYIGRKTQIHIRLCLLNNTFDNEIHEAQEIYSQIAKETHGTFALVKLNDNNDLYVMQSTKNILNTSDSAIVYSSLNSSDDEFENIKKLENMRDTDKKELLNVAHWDNNISDMLLQHTTSQEGLYKPFDLWKRVSASNSYLECMRRFHESTITEMSQQNVSNLAASVIVGRQVLARKYTNGQYYIGYVKEKINNDVFNVVFGPYDWGKGQFIAKDYQQTRLYDLIDFNDAIKRSIVPGDRVLAPDPTSGTKDIHLCRFLTGTVLHGSVIREYSIGKASIIDIIADKSKETPIQSSPNLIIEFTHPLSKTEKVLSDKVIYIPEPFFQRLCLEGVMPKSAREKLYKIPNYPLSSLPGYPTSGSKKNPIDFTFTNLNVIKSRTLQVDYLMPPYCLPLYPIVEIFEKDDRTGNVISKSDWASESLVKKSNFFKKDDIRVPESIYTVNELDLKVKDLLETFKHLSSPKSTGEKSFFRKNISKVNDNEPRTAKAIHIKPTERTSPTKMVTVNEKKLRVTSSPAHSVSDDADVAGPKLGNKILSKFSIHEEYFDELNKIKETGVGHQGESYASSIFEFANSKRVSQKSNEDIFISKTTSNETKPQLFVKNISKNNESSNSNVACINDLGERDKEREKVENMKIHRHQRQIQKQLNEEKYKYCDEERAKDIQINFHRQKTAERIHKENQILQREQEAIDKAQMIKREILSEVENKVTPVEPIPQSYDDIDAKKIEFLRKRMENRTNEKQKRDEEALKYIEKIEMNRRFRNNDRWCEAQNKMLKEFPEKN